MGPRKGQARSSVMFIGNERIDPIVEVRERGMYFCAIIQEAFDAPYFVTQRAAKL